MFVAMLTPGEILFLCVGLVVFCTLSGIGFYICCIAGGRADESRVREKLYWEEVERRKREK